MIKKEYKLGNEGREDIKAVSTQVLNVLGKTLGPAGRNYFLPMGITNDGRTIMSELRFEDICQDQASLAFHEVAQQQDKDAGDGTTTAMVLAAQLALDTLDQVPDIDVPAPGANTVMKIAEQLDEEKDQALKLLKDKVIKVDSPEQLRKVALTAMENEAGADIVAETMWEAGKNAYPALKEGFNGKIEKEVLPGLELPLNIATTSMFNNIGRAEYENVPVLVVNHCFESYLELAPFMMSMLAPKQKQTALIIVAKQFSIPFINGVTEATMRSKFPIILVSADFHNDTFEDIASFVDAQLLDTHPKTGKKITEAKFEMAGFAKTVIAREKNAQFIGGRGLDALVGVDKEKIVTRVQSRVEVIKKLQETEKNEDERNQMERRMAALQGGIASIYVDAKTAAERYYLKLKTEDAMNSCRAALNDGMVWGGGRTLNELGIKMPDSMLANALCKQMEQIRQNNSGELLDDTNVWDAYLVVKSAIENAVSVVKTLCTIEGIISDVEPSLVDDLQNKLNPQN